ncbi:BrnA antitoxin family protein [Pararhizobium mangrovi]|uniref:BrnA antitoxin family protein n=1 Tax=Pararhizobium mangrovi TaxID=2590452 RepID=UPI001F20F92F|nr:BrnA antitoxin family protein [Pararhizobium mangrovi]
METSTSKLIGLDPEPERPRAIEEIAKAKPFVEAHTDLAETLKRSPGQPRKVNPNETVTLRLDPHVVARFKAGGEDWRARIVQAIEKND